MAPPQPKTNCASFSGSRLPVGKCQMLSCSWKRFLEQALASSRKSRSANSLRAGSGKLSLCSVTRVDAHVFRGEIASPITRCGSARMQIHQNVHMLFQQTIAGHALVEIERLPPAQHRDACHLNVHQVRVEFDAGTARSGEDAAPVGIASGKGGLDERR